MKKIKKTKKGNPKTESDISAGGFPTPPKKKLQSGGNPKPKKKK